MDRRTGKGTALVGRFVDKIGAGIGNSGNKIPQSPGHQGMAGGAGAGKNPWKHNKNKFLDDGAPVGLQWILESPLKTLGLLGLSGLRGGACGGAARGARCRRRL